MSGFHCRTAETQYNNIAVDEKPEYDAAWV